MVVHRTTVQFEANLVYKQQQQIVMESQAAALAVLVRAIVKCTGIFMEQRSHLSLLLFLKSQKWYALTRVPPLKDEDKLFTRSFIE